jgi:hypothetical protein
VRVVPSAARTQIRGLYGDRLKIAVNAPPEGGRANARLVQALATWLGTKSEDVRIESGHGSRDKMVAFFGIKESALRAKLSVALYGEDTTAGKDYGP